MRYRGPASEWSSELQVEVSMSKALNPQLLPGRITAAHCSFITEDGWVGLGPKALNLPVTTDDQSVKREPQTQPNRHQERKPTCQMVRFTESFEKRTQHLLFAGQLAFFPASRARAPPGSLPTYAIQMQRLLCCDRDVPDQVHLYLFRLLVEEVLPRWESSEGLDLCQSGTGCACYSLLVKLESAGRARQRPHFPLQQHNHLVRRRDDHEILIFLTPARADTATQRHGCYREMILPLQSCAAQIPVKSREERKYTSIRRSAKGHDGSPTNSAAGA
ncbi:hypothetical protein EYF80_028930 [Liparis tanakae]|uniref:Uncharacterized protein n=1 Tax=Liparis tanakae TaxID=230148 RepID=A0A4Z2H735_9TELE|nr:hypothetical protein EYF80_028930 [Liparis tanakae]